MSIGFSGFLDYSGLPVGEGVAAEEAPIPFGFSGFLDFVGYPVAAGTGVVILPRKGRGGFRGAGRYANALIQRMQLDRRVARKLERRLPPLRIVSELLAERLYQTHQETYRIKQKRLVERAAYAVLLSEL